MEPLTHWLRTAEAWLDARGKGAWIAAMVLGFIFLWPVGLAILFFMIWSNRMSCSSKFKNHRRWNRDNSTGNSVFDAYRVETMKRLEEEQGAFHSFMTRLRKAKDQAEFDQFMDDRVKSRDETIEMPA